MGFNENIFQVENRENQNSSRWIAEDEPSKKILEYFVRAKTKDFKA